MTQKIRVLVATGLYPPSVGGPATYSKLLHDELPKRGIEVRVVSFDEVRSYPKVIRHFLYFLKLLKNARGVTHIYAQDPVSVGLPALCASFFMRKRFWLKVVGDFAWEQGVQKYKVQDMLDEFSQKKKGYAFYVQLLKKVEVFVAGHAESVIVPSTYLKSIVVNWGVDPDRVYVIYNGFAGITLDIKNKDDARTALGLSGTAILSGGRLVPWKGYDTLIGLIPELLLKFSDIHLYIAGEGPQKKELESYVEKLGIQKQVTFLGALSKDSMHTYMVAADVFVLNTAYEGLSHMLLETLSLGLPTITTKVGGNPEVIEDGVSGRLVPYNDAEKLSEAIEQTLTQDGVKEVYASKGRKVVKKFSQENMLKEFVDFIKNHENN